MTARDIKEAMIVEVKGDDTPYEDRDHLYWFARYLGARDLLAIALATIGILLLVLVAIVVAR